jgi:hypothetical protein
MNSLRSSAAIAAVVLVLPVANAAAQNDAGANPKVVVDNDQMRVLEYVARPGEDVCGVGEHSHPAHLTVIIDPAKVRDTAADGRSIEVEPPRGMAFWSEAQTHSARNVGTTTSRALLIEVKAAPNAR